MTDRAADATRTNAPTKEGKMRTSRKKWNQGNLELNSFAMQRERASHQVRIDEPVEPVFARLRRRLDRDYTPEQASEICEAHPDVIRMLARKVASKRTRLSMGMGAAKYYHGDLISRSAYLLLALTGNWGKKGAGTGSWNSFTFDGTSTVMAKTKPGVEGGMEVVNLARTMREQVIRQDPTLTGELLRLSNSSFFGGIEKVVTVRDAVMRLGIKQVAELVILSGQKRYYQLKDPLLGSFVERLWRHAVGCGIGSDWLASKLRLGEVREEAFMAGLLHDVGKLLLLRVIDDHMASWMFCHHGPRSVAANVPPGVSSLRHAKYVVFPTASNTKSNVSPICVKSSAV